MNKVFYKRQDNTYTEVTILAMSSKGVAFVVLHGPVETHSCLYVPIKHLIRGK